MLPGTGAQPVQAHARTHCWAARRMPIGLACSRRLSCRWGTPARWLGRRRYRADDRPRVAVTCGPAGGWRNLRRLGALSRVSRPPGLRAAAGCQAATPAAPFPDKAPGRSLAGWTMIEVFDTAAARCALARRMLRYPDCGQALRPWGRARERAVRELGGALLTVRPGPCPVHRLRCHPRGPRRGPAAAPRLRRRPGRPGPGGRRPGARAPAHRTRAGRP